MITTRFDGPTDGRSVHPRPVMNATTARALVVHVATTVILGAVVLLAAWQFMFPGGSPGR
jgi:hypothetical protein